MITVEFKDLDEMMYFAKQLTAGGAPVVASASEPAPVLVPCRVERQETIKKKESPTESQEEEIKSKSDQSDESPEYTLVQIREELTKLQKAGKRTQVQELIAGFGVKKLVEVPEDRYGELMEKAGEL